MSRTRTCAIFAPIVVVMVVIDALSKRWAAATLHSGVTSFDWGLVDFTLVHNTGAAFGMGQGNGMFFVAIACIISIAAIAWLFISKRHTSFEVVGLALVVAGAIGNCIDRLTTGYVVDFIRFTFIDFPVFNVADICVTCGVIIFVISMLHAEFSSAGRDGQGAGQ